MECHDISVLKYSSTQGQHLFTYLSLERPHGLIRARAAGVAGEGARIPNLPGLARRSGGRRRWGGGGGSRRLSRRWGGGGGSRRLGRRWGRGGRGRRGVSGWCA